MPALQKSRKRTAPPEGRRGCVYRPDGGGYFPVAFSYFSFHFLLRSSTPSMCLMVLQVARAAPRMAKYSVSMISSSEAPACFAAAKRAGTQLVQPAAAMAASATSDVVFWSSAPSR